MSILAQMDSVQLTFAGVQMKREHFAANSDSRLLT
jgi:hypothetical protein